MLGFIYLVRLLEFFHIINLFFPLIGIFALPELPCDTATQTENDKQANIEIEKILTAYCPTQCSN